MIHFFTTYADAGLVTLILMGVLAHSPRLQLRLLGGLLPGMDLMGAALTFVLWPLALGLIVTTMITKKDR